MKKIKILLICLISIFTLSQCDNSIIIDDEIPTVKPLSFDFSSVAFIARITYNSSDWSLCIMDSDGNNMRKIVDFTTTCSKPVRSNSGNKLLFLTYTTDYKYELYSVNIDGSNLTLIGQNCLSPAWSPDDKYIAYIKPSDSHWNSSELILYNTFDRTHKVLNVMGDVIHNPKFSPCGRYIAYCAEIKADTMFMHTHRNHHIYTVDVNGKNNKLIIEEGSAPLWSPQGNKIAYLSSGEGGSSQIFVANANGSNQKQLTTTISPHQWPGPWAADGNSDPQWTLDGKKIVYVSWENGRPEIFIMNVDGSNKTRLTTAEFRDESPEITPDGKHILYNSRRTDMMNGEIFIMTLDGKNERLLSEVGVYPTACK